MDEDLEDEETDDGSLLLSRIEIMRYLDPEGRDDVTYNASDAAGNDLPLIETLGLLRMAEVSAVIDWQAAQAEAEED